MRWAGLSREKVGDIAERFEAAHVIAMARACAKSPESEMAAKQRYPEMSDGILFALAQELKELGCPPGEVAPWAAMIINAAARNRIARATGSSGGLH